MSEYDKAAEAAAFLKGKVNGPVPEIGIVCGTGLAGLIDGLDPGAQKVPYKDIPHFKTATVQGHTGEIVLGTIGSRSTPVVCISGRLHTYEGLDIKDTVFSIRALGILGIKTLIVTNAAGGLNPEYKVGDLMVISDHINLPGIAGLNPLKGPNDERFGSRFTPMNNAYEHELRYKFFQSVDKLKLKRRVHEGVYSYVSGPNYETAAECRLLIGLGGDAVGMSTVPEILVAVHSGIKVLGISLITNEAITAPPLSGRDVPGSGPKLEPSHEEVLEAGNNASKDVEKLVIDLIESNH